MMQWDPSYSVKQPHLDKEHQSLFTALNQFYEGLRKGVPKESMYTLIEDLIHYTKTHFASEEKHMQTIGFPGLQKHQEEHRAFEAKVEDFYSKVKNGKLLMSVEITNFIKDWILNHIQTQDQQYANFQARN